MTKDGMSHPLRDSQQDIEAAEHRADMAQTRASAYRLAFADDDFLTRPETRPIRLQLELMKPELIMAEREIMSTIVLFGGARIPEPAARARARTPTLAGLSHYYDVAREFARIMTLRSLASGGKEDVIVTGGGPGVMEAGNRGAQDAGGASIGLNVVLPHEQEPNPYVTPELCFNFHYFAVRKMHFLMRARAIAVFPGGFGTMDELFEALTLIQTRRMAALPFLLFGEDFWRRIINWDALAEAGTISQADLGLFRFVETAEDAVAAIDSWVPPEPVGGPIPT
ncbi:LOG family protein [Halodurantibacterium flavum]|uniref:AMP nucleosidase n=1 Tax=Halodurantibacterium flavum TaxID=1382802 RepID=A0ABW4S4R7_9RHOB